MKIHLTLNDPPYGTERSYNGLRLALALLKTEPKPDVSVFLMGDAVACAKSGQKTPDGYYNMARMVKAVARGGHVALCGTCMDARGIADGELVAGAGRGTMSDLARLTMEADRVLVF